MGVAIRASRKLKNEELLVTALAGTRLRMELDQVPLWRGDHVAVKQLAVDFARYLYLPRLKSPSILTQAIRDGLRAGEDVPVAEDDPGLLVRPEVARRQLQAQQPAASAPSGPEPAKAAGGTRGPSPTGTPPLATPVRRPTRFHGSVQSTGTTGGISINSTRCLTH